MRNYFFALKQYYKSAPVLITIQLLFTTVPVGLLAGLTTNSGRNLINTVQGYIGGVKSIDYLTQMFIWFAVFSVASVLLSQIVIPFLREFISRKNELEFNKFILNKYSTIKYEYFEQEKMRDLFEKTNNSELYAQSTFNTTESIIRSVISITSVVVVLWAISPLFSILSLVVGLAVFGLFFLRARISINVWGFNGIERRKIRAVQRVFNGENLKRAQAELRVFGTNPKMIDYVQKNVVENELILQKKERKMRICMYVSDALTSFFGIAVLIYIAVKLINGTLNWPIGNIIVAITGFSSLSYRFANISRNVSSVIESSKKISFLRDFVALEDEKEGTINSISPNASIEIKNVTFAYPGTTRQVLKNVSFNIKCGEHIAFVGENGSGKSTIIKLILGLYTPTKGEILVDGHPITDYTYAARQNLFGIQFQDFYSYNLKVRETVAVGDISILNDDNRIKNTLSRANILKAIKAKDATLDTIIGKNYDEDSIEFSGGEKQRMSLATTLAYNHKHLILDEPTAALDAKAENLMYEVFMSGIKNKGSLIVSHRLASARISDRIIVFKDGTVVQDGGHNELMKNKKGLYYKMFTSQAELYKGGDEK